MQSTRALFVLLIIGDFQTDKWMNISPGESTR